jgi:hypothetical protein
MQWRDVVKSLGSQQGISTRGGKVVTLLCGSRYEDYIQEGQIIYYVEPDTPGLMQLLETARNGYSFRVFWRRAPNDWEALGFHKFVGFVEERREEGTR